MARIVAGGVTGDGKAGEAGRHLLRGYEAPSR